jgi:hypothetical protein
VLVPNISLIQISIISCNFASLMKLSSAISWIIASIPALFYIDRPRLGYGPLALLSTLDILRTVTDLLRIGRVSGCYS